MILMMSIKMGVSGTCTIENLLKIPSDIYRKSIENLSNIYRTSIEHLWIWGGPGVDLGWILGVSGCIWVDLGGSGVELAWIFGSKIYRKSIEHLSNIYRTSIEHLSKIYRKSIDGRRLARRYGLVTPQYGDYVPTS